MSGRTIRVATRPSPLALRQTEIAATAMRARWPDVEVRVVALKSEGDAEPKKRVADLGDKGVFVARIERALLEGEADVAVHSLKDLPGEPTPGLCLAACLPREDPRDVLISNAGLRLSALPAGSRVGTSSLRRQVQLREARPDLRFVDIRGNVDTRLRKLDAREFDAIVLAAAGLRRLGIEHSDAKVLDPEVCTPAPGQGIIALQCRAGDAFGEPLGDLNDIQAAAEGGAEREVSAMVGAGCGSAFGALATVRDGDISLRAAWLGQDGMLRRASGRSLAEDAGSLLEEVRGRLVSPA